MQNTHTHTYTRTHAHIRHISVCHLPCFKLLSDTLSGFCFAFRLYETISHIFSAFFFPFPSSFFRLCFILFYFWGGVTFKLHSCPKLWQLLHWSDSWLFFVVFVLLLCRSCDKQTERRRSQARHTVGPKVARPHCVCELVRKMLFSACWA